MELIRQQPGSQLCGACVLAMIADIPLKDAQRLREGRTYPSDMWKAFASVGFEMSRSSTKTVPVGEIAAVFISSLPIGGRNIQHWVAWDGSKFLCPLKGEMDRLPEEAEYGFHLVRKAAPC